MKRTVLGAAWLILAAFAPAAAQDGDRPAHGHDRHPGRGGHGHAEPAANGKTLVGEEAKDFTLEDSVGEVFRLSALRRTDEQKGSIAVLTFWCTTCHSCRGMELDFDEKAREIEAKGVTFRMIASNGTETAERVNRFLEKRGLDFKVLMDEGSEIARRFGVTRTTTTIVIDAAGKIRYYGRYAKALDAVRSLLDGEDVRVPWTPPAG